VTISEGLCDILIRLFIAKESNIHARIDFITPGVARMARRRAWAHPRGPLNVCRCLRATVVSMLCLQQRRLTHNFKPRCCLSFSHGNVNWQREVRILLVTTKRFVSQICFTMHVLARWRVVLLRGNKKTFVLFKWSPISVIWLQIFWNGRFWRVFFGGYFTTITSTHTHTCAHVHMRAHGYEYVCYCCHMHTHIHHHYYYHHYNPLLLLLSLLSLSSCAFMSLSLSLSLSLSKTKHKTKQTHHNSLCLLSLSRSLSDAYVSFSDETHKPDTYSCSLMLLHYYCRCSISFQLMCFVTMWNLIKVSRTNTNRNK